MLAHSGTRIQRVAFRESSMYLNLNLYLYLYLSIYIYIYICTAVLHVPNHWPQPGDQPGDRPALGAASELTFQDPTAWFFVL